MKVKIVKKALEAKGTYSFFFESDKVTAWLPGQYYYLTLPKLNYPDPRGTTRHFTISSSPTEGNLLRVTTRIRETSGYKKTLMELTEADIISMEGPNGTFILDEAEKGKNHVFLAGGIGITPFRSFIKYNIDKSLSIPMHLIYSNSNEEGTAFLKELTSWEKENSFLKIKNIFTEKDGRMDQEKLTSILSSWKLTPSDPTYWVVGPPGFVDATEDILGKMKVSSAKIQVEKFTGY